MKRSQRGGGGPEKRVTRRLPWLPENIGPFERRITRSSRQLPEPSESRRDLSESRRPSPRARGPPSWAELAAKYRQDPLQPPPTPVSVSPNVKSEDWERFAHEIMNIPIYLIVCHAAICPNYAACRTPSRSNEPTLPTFTIPKSTYILNFTAGGEYCLFGPQKANNVRRYQDEFRKLLLINDRSDVERNSTYEYSFVSNVQRAASSAQVNVEYPNISCTFTEEITPSNPVNESGVFRLDTMNELVNQNSIIRSADIDPGPYADDVETWYLDDVIQTTYARTGIHKGIFLFAGCTSEFTAATSRANLAGNIGKSSDQVQRMIYDAETNYGSLVPTIDRDTMKRLAPGLLANDPGFQYPFTQITPTSAAGFAAELGETLEGAMPDLKTLDSANYAKAQEMLAE